MTWSVRVTRPDGTVPTKEGSQYPDYHACQSCQHGQYDYATGGANFPTISPCYSPKATGGIGSVLTSIDTGADGHMACGEALLKCSEYEAVEGV